MKKEIKKKMSKKLNDILIGVEKLSIKEKKHIFNILMDTECGFTKNNTGYFFNLNSINQDAIKKISDCIDLIYRHRELITKMDNKREEEMIYYKKLIKEKQQLRKKEQDDNIYNTLVIKVNTDIIYEIIKESKIINKIEYTEFKIKPKHPYYLLHQKIKSLNKSSNKNFKKIIKEKKTVDKDTDETLYDNYSDEEPEPEPEEQEEPEPEPEEPEQEEEPEKNLKPKYDSESESESEVEIEIEEELNSILNKNIDMLTESDYLFLQSIDTINAKNKMNAYNNLKTENMIFKNIKDKMIQYRHILTEYNFVFNILLQKEEIIKIN
jgi:hypothetical protein